jgi:AraC-like DNA-binding protein
VNSNALSRSTGERHVSAFMLRGFWDELEKRHVSVPELERQSRVTRPLSGDYSSTLVESDMHRLLETAVALTGDQALGLTAGRAMGAASFHLLSHMVLASANLAEAVDLAARAQPQLRRRPPALQDLGDGRLRLGFFKRSTGTLGARVEAEMTGVLLHETMLHFYARGSSELPVMQFAHRAPADAERYREFFPGGVQFEADGTFVVAPHAALVQHRTGADDRLLMRLFNLTQEFFGSADTDDAWVGRVRNALRVHPTPLLVDCATLANDMGLSSRALARRLTREGSNFTSLLEEVAYERAGAMLRRGARGSEVANALGYAELSSFFRAFRRWTGGLTPSEYRRRHSS